MKLSIFYLSSTVQVHFMICRKEIIKVLITCIVSCFFLFSGCTSKEEYASQQHQSGIVPKPESREVRGPGEKLNMMLLMDVEDASEEMDEVIVIPPKDKEKS